MGNFCRSLDLPLTICEIEIDLSWSKECIISEISIIPRIPPLPDANPLAGEVAAIQTTGITFQITNAKLYVPLYVLCLLMIILNF